LRNRFIPVLRFDNLKPLALEPGPEKQSRIIEVIDDEEA